MRQTEEDLKIIKKYLELPYLLDVLEVDKRKIGEGNLKMAKIYVRRLEQIQDLVTKDIYAVKQEMKRKNIKMIDQTRLDDRLVAEYLCRNYKHKITLLWSKVKSDIEIDLANYVGVKLE